MDTIIEKIIEERNAINENILSIILPQNIIDNIYIKDLSVFNLPGSTWFIKDNIVFIGDEFDIKDFINKNKKIRKIAKINIFYVKEEEDSTYVIEDDGYDHYTIYILDNYEKYNKTYEKRKQDSWNKLIESIKTV
jgi:hypothetical protein